jgi:hypothetical protein
VRLTARPSVTDYRDLLDLYVVVQRQQRWSVALDGSRTGRDVDTGRISLYAMSLVVADEHGRRCGAAVFRCVARAAAAARRGGCLMLWAATPMTADDTG